MHAALTASISSDLFTVTVPLLEKVLRTIGVYVGILALLRVSGKRDLAQLNTFDLVVLLLLSNVVQNAVIGDDVSLFGGLVGAATLMVVNSFMVRVAQRGGGPVVRVLEGTPTTLVRDGKIQDAALNRLGLRDADVRVALRQQGAQSLEDVQEAVLEPGGSIVLTLRPGAEPATAEDVARLEAKLDRLLAS
jgi:uncharacterized membrane protein YcaP (DUF421 family)